jgi:hypothetical protein
MVGAWASAALVLLVTVVSCGKLTGVVKPNAAPQTTLFVQGPVDTVNHVVQLFWYGTDPAGRVVGYEVRMLNPEAPADTAWRFTTLTDSVVTVLSPQGAVSPVFEVRAIDDDGLRDPTPARQLFNFRNTPPLVRLTLKPGVRDTTFASVTVGWSISDPDGDASKVVYRVWLDGQEANPELTTGTTFTMPSERFKVGGVYTSGPRTLYVQGIDDGGMAGPRDSVTWQVRRPVSGARARLLIVDDVPASNAVGTRIDSLYEYTAARYLTPDQYTVLKLERNQPFASAKDIEQTFKLFEAVVWYRGNEVSVASVLREHRAGIGPYLEAGGRFYIDGLYLFEGTNASGALDEQFARDYLECDGLRRTFVSVTAFTDSTLGFGNVNGAAFFSTMYADSLIERQLAVQAGQAGGFRVFRPRRISDIALVAAPGAITPAAAESLVVGVSVPQPSGGRAIVLCVPVGTSVASITAPPVAVLNSRFLAKAYEQMGLATP